MELNDSPSATPLREWLKSKEQVVSIWAVVLFCKTVFFVLPEFIVEAEEKLHTGEGKGIWKTWERISGNQTQVQLTLRPFCTYRFRIIAVNEAGESSPSEPTEDHVTPPAGKTAILISNPCFWRYTSDLQNNSMFVLWLWMVLLGKACSYFALFVFNSCGDRCIGGVMCV